MKNTISLSLLILIATSSLVYGEESATTDSGPRGGFVADNVEPIVPPFRDMMIEGTVFEKGEQAIDGISCVNCVFRNMTLMYSGGEYRLVNPKFENVIIKFKGAALNSKLLYEYFMVRRSSPVPPKQRPDPNANPKVQINIPISGLDLISPGAQR